MGSRLAVRGLYDMELEVGDIILVKSEGGIGSWVSWALGGSGGGLWKRRGSSNHNAIIGYVEERLCVVEMLTSGIKATTVRSYFGRDGEKKPFEWVVARVPYLTSCNRSKIQFALEGFYKAKTRYDYSSYISHIWRAFVGLPALFNTHSRNKLYCTELVAECYKVANIPLFIKGKLPTPKSIERLVVAQDLVVVCKNK